MRSLAIVLILAICAPAVLCQNDDPLFYFSYWLTPIATNPSATSEAVSIDAVESTPDFLPSDVYYDRDQLAPVQYKTESKTDTTATSAIEEMASESSKSTDASNERAQQALVDSEFFKHFMAILSKLEKEQIEEQANKDELNKFTGKKYNPNDEKKSFQFFKAENPIRSVADTVSFGFENTASSSSHSQQISTSKTDSSSSENSGDIFEESPDYSSESSEESSSGKNYRYQLSNDNSESTTSKDTSSKTSSIYLDSESFYVPLAPFPDDYSPVPYIVEKSSSYDKMTDKRIDDTLPRMPASTIPILSAESTKEDKAQESSISQPSTDDTSVSKDKADNWDNLRTAEIQSSATSNTKEENFEIISSNDETMDAVSTKTENVESTKADEAESTDDYKNKNEIDNEIPVNDKPLGQISFGQFMKALIKRMVL